MICKNNCNVSRDFLGRPIVAGGYGEGGGGVLCTLLMGPGQSPGGDHVAKLPEAPRI